MKNNSISGTKEATWKDKQAGVHLLSIGHFRSLFVLLTLLALIPFWTVRYPVITDYPNHLARWFVLHHIEDPLYHFSALYVPAWGPLPYITPDLLAVGLQYVLPIDIVGRCILSVCIIFVALGSFFFVRSTCPEHSNLALFGLLVAFNPNFMMGSLSNELSIGFSLLAISFWVKYCSSRRTMVAICVLLGLILVYLSHLIGFVITGAVMGVYALFQSARWKRLADLAIVSLPALALSIHNFLRSGPPGKFSYAGLTFWDKFRNLTFPVRLFASRASDLVVLAVLIVLSFLLIRAQRRVTVNPAWFSICIILTLAYFVAPGEYFNGGYVDVRIMPFLYLFLLAAFRFENIPRYIVFALASLVLFRIASVEIMFISHQNELRGLTAAFDIIPRNATVLPINTLEGNRGLVAGDAHHLDYGVIQRGFLVPTLFHLPGVQPIRLTNASYCPNAFCYLTNPSELEWAHVALSVDYIWVQHYDAPVIPSDIGQQVFSNRDVAVYRLTHSN